MTTAVQLFRTEDAPAGFLDRLRPMLTDVFSHRFDDHDWAHGLGGWHSVVTVDGTTSGAIVAHAAVVERTIEAGRRAWRAGYVEAVATVAASRGSGAGSAAMRAITGVVDEQFEFGALATGSHGFYERLGWERWLGESFVRDDDSRRRTPDDDESLMVRRTGPTATVELTGPIVCPPRAGALW